MHTTAIRIQEKFLPSPHESEHRPQDTPVVYLLIRNKADYKKQLIKKLKPKFGKSKTMKLVKKLSGPIVSLSSHSKAQTGLVKLKMKKTSLHLFHYLMKFQGKSEKFIEVYLQDLCANINLSEMMESLFSATQKSYKQFLKAITDPAALSYLKLIGKGKSDYDIEKRLGLSRVELIDLKQALTTTLDLRHMNELYWVSQRAGYVQ